jgi:hypothetical protein
MCDYCDCRSAAPIAALSDDHAELKRLAAHVRRAAGDGDGARAADAFDALVRVLGPHADTEERGLFRALRACGEYVERADLLEAQHRELFDLAADLDPAADPTGVLRLLDHLDAHIHLEEYDLFPAVALALDTDGWAIVHDAHEHGGHAVASHSERRHRAHGARGR